MTLLVDFGKDYSAIIEWNDDLMTFPKIIRKDNNYYEWVMYAGATSSSIIDYELSFSLIKNYNNSTYSGTVTDWADLYYGRKTSTKCECGSEIVNGVNCRHAWYCPKAFL